jgi:hypothetical protein
MNSLCTYLTQNIKIERPHSVLCSSANERYWPLPLLNTITPYCKHTEYLLVDGSTVKVTRQLQLLELLYTFFFLLLFLSFTIS